MRQTGTSAVTSVRRYTATLRLAARRSKHFLCLCARISSQKQWKCHQSLWEKQNQTTRHHNSETQCIYKYTVRLAAIKGQNCYFLTSSIFQKAFISTQKHHVALWNANSAPLHQKSPLWSNCNHIRADFFTLFTMTNSSLGERVTGQQTVLKRVQDGRIS